jgi:hypothetical protein
MYREQTGIRNANIELAPHGEQALSMPEGIWNMLLIRLEPV